MKAVIPTVGLLQTTSSMHHRLAVVPLPHYDIPKMADSFLKSFLVGQERMVSGLLAPGI